ncbi:MAG: hypothetical protein PHI06_12840 [Desulfobulbaceae bacterium]|nr:hypothetical protein [Desulfobulbaceae bacterium]
MILETPLDILDAFSQLLAQSAIPDQNHNYYRKWLRYYLDFCRKNVFGVSSSQRVDAVADGSKGKAGDDSLP